MSYHRAAVMRPNPYTGSSFVPDLKKCLVPHGKTLANFQAIGLGFFPSADEYFSAAVCTINFVYKISVLRKYLIFAIVDILFILYEIE